MTFSRPKHSKTDAPTEDLREFMAVTRVHLFILEQYLVVKNVNSCNMEYDLVFTMHRITSPPYSIHLEKKFLVKVIQMSKVLNLRCKKVCQYYK